ncbi:MAG: cytochrome c biogenesis protein ResB [Actinobacteria bacterium]|nr:cytochrome c biogenesis protein ResB [Actinomycetota bacterium]
MSSAVAKLAERLRKMSRILSAPRFAVWLMVVLGIYLVVGSIFPQRSLDRAGYAVWAADNPTLSAVTEALGLDAPFIHPVFFAIVALLTISTILCSIQRTERALRIYRAVGVPSQKRIAAVRKNPRLRIELEVGREQELYDRAIASLRHLKLRVAGEPGASHGYSGAWGLFGSPVFHWTLVGLFLVISGGMLTRSEGLLGIVENTQRLDVEESYGLLQRGPLHGEMSGMIIGIAGTMPDSFVYNGIERGPVPEVYLKDGDRELARGKVFPNHPLRYSSYLIHLTSTGLGIVTTTVAEDDGEERSTQVFIDRDPVNPAVWGTASEIFLDEQGTEVSRATFSTAPGTRKVRVDVTRADGTSEGMVLGIGETIKVKDGYSLRIDYLGAYARLSVVDDWSLPFIYFFFALATVAVGISVLVPYRGVWVVLDSSGDKPSICVTVSHSRGDSLFVDSVKASIEQAVREGRS